MEENIFYDVLKQFVVTIRTRAYVFHCVLFVWFCRVASLLVVVVDDVDIVPFGLVMFVVCHFQS